MFTLNTVLRLNAASCLIFGLLFVLFSLQTATYLGESSAAPDWVIQVLGAVLIFNGFDLLRVSFKDSISKASILYFSAGDFIWVIATTVLIVCNIWITTTAGIVAGLATSVMVGAFGYMQIIIYRK